MSRPAIAACVKCQTRIFSRIGRSLNPSAYTCTTAASSTRSRRYRRSVILAILIEVYALLVFGDVDVPAALAADACGERVERGRLAVNEEGAARRAREVGQPAHDFVRVGVRGHGVDAFDARGDRDVEPV